MKKITLLIIFLFVIQSVYSINFTTTAESISWNGAYTSVSDGFESMLYNPAGLFLTNSRFGINIFGSYGIRFYSNSITSDKILKLFQAMEKEINLSSSDLLPKMLLYMPENGVDFGIEASAFNFMTYSKINDFSFGVYLLPKSNLSFTMDKGIFSTIFNNIEITSPKKYSAKFVMLQYLDLNTMLSTRAKFLENIMPAVEKIYVGMGIHWYFPTLFVKSSAGIKLSAGAPNSLGVIDNYNLAVKGNMYAGANGMFVGILSAFPESYNLVSGLLQYGGSAAFGIGFDFGTIFQFNKYVRLGFAVTDIGFLVFPQTAVTGLNYTFNLNENSLNAFMSNFIDVMKQKIKSSDTKLGEMQWWMPDTAIRFGIAVTPFRNDLLIWSSDVSLSDLNKLIIGGYPTFNISTGLEFKPSYQWFAMPIRGALSYNTQANNISLSFGIGLYLGPVEMEIAVKGIEFLISEVGAKELCAGADLKFEF